MEKTRKLTIAGILCIVLGCIWVIVQISWWYWFIHEVDYGLVIMLIVLGNWNFDYFALPFILGIIALIGGISLYMQNKLRFRLVITVTGLLMLALRGYCFLVLML